jgi:hypothetical protein
MQVDLGRVIKWFALVLLVAFAVWLLIVFLTTGTSSGGGGVGGEIPGVSTTP